MKARKSKLWKQINIEQPELAKEIVRKTIGNTNEFTFTFNGNIYKCSEL